MALSRAQIMGLEIGTKVLVRPSEGATVYANYKAGPNGDITEAINMEFPAECVVKNNGRRFASGKSFVSVESIEACENDDDYALSCLYANVLSEQSDGEDQLHLHGTGHWIVEKVI